MERPRNVLRINAVEEQASYRTAVARILTDIQHETHDTLIDIAEKIGVSLGTMSNAANKKCDLSPTFLQRLGRLYGAHVLDPYLALCGARAVPLHSVDHRDVLPFINRAAMKIAEARDPAGPGGVREVHKERFDYLNDLIAMQKEVTALICKIEAERAAA